MAWCEVGLTGQVWERPQVAKCPDHFQYTKGQVGSTGREGRKYPHSALHLGFMVDVKLLPSARGRPFPSRFWLGGSKFS